MTLPSELAGANVRPSGPNCDVLTSPEAVRDYLGVEKMQLYGESYGTQYVQTYAAAHPDRCRP